MGFLKRALGASAPTPTWDIPPSGYIKVAGVMDHAAEIGTAFGRREDNLNEDVAVTLRRDPRNASDPNAVEVRLQGVTAGYLPKEIAAAWAPLLDRVEQGGRVPTAIAKVWYRWPSTEARPQVHVNIRIDDRPDPSL